MLFRYHNVSINIYIDLSKAFDRLIYDSLLHTLHHAVMKYTFAQYSYDNYCLIKQLNERNRFFNMIPGAHDFLL